VPVAVDAFVPLLVRPIGLPSVPVATCRSDRLDIIDVSFSTSYIRGR
jgi:hypothetical protein